jgi:hypothetical protein
MHDSQAFLVHFTVIETPSEAGKTLKLGWKSTKLRQITSVSELKGFCSHFVKG